MGAFDDLFREELDGKPRQVEVVAQIERVISASQALTKELDYDVIKKKIIESGLADSKVWGKARIFPSRLPRALKSSEIKTLA